MKGVENLIHKIRKNKLVLSIFVIICVSIAALSPLLGNNSYIHGHDTTWHVQTIDAMSQLKIGELLDVRMVGKMMNDLGYPVGIFYPQFAHIVATFIYKITSPLGASVYAAAKATHFLILCLSGIFMYLLLLKLTKSHKISLVAAIIYMVMPYHLVDILIRDTFGEELLFVFLPLLGLSFYYLAHEKFGLYLPLFVVACFGLVNSHLALAMYIAIFGVIFILLNFKTFINPKKISFLIAGGILAISVCTPFILPILEQHSTSEIVALSTDYLTANREYRAHISPYALLFYDQNAEVGIPFFLNIAAIAIIVYAHIFGSLKNKQRKQFFVSLSIIGLIIIFMIVGIFVKMDSYPETLKMIQFFWRLEVILIFTLSIQAAISLKSISSEKIKSAAMFSMLILAAFGVEITLEHMLPIETRAIQQEYEEQYRFREYLPVKAFENFEYLKNKTEDVVVKEGAANVSDVVRNTPNLDFKVETKKGTTLELPLLYYIGYEIKSLDANESKDVEYKESENGFIEIFVPQNANIRVRYVGTNIMHISKVIFFVGSITTIICTILLQRKNEH
ncbi:hypothetical protein IKF33_02080 [Candidatus Saccharibacteria bacterium]|nr:hypothetical protein [Candidatus Saccharibacteria bacterium]